MRGLQMRLAIAAVSLLIAGVGLIAAIVFFCIAVYCEFLTFIDPPMAALATAGAALLFSIIVILLGQLLMGRSRRWSRDPTVEMGRKLGEQARTLLSSNKRATFFALLAAGFVVGASPRLRKILRALIGI
jgi:hypothetical protein